MTTLLLAENPVERRLAMGVNRVNKRGKSRIEVRKRWPDGSTFRRYYSNKTIAKHMLARLAQDAIDAHAAELAGSGDDEALVGTLLAFAITRHHERVKRGESTIDDLTGHQTVRQVFEGIAKAAVQVNFTVGNMFATTPGEMVIDVLGDMANGLKVTEKADETMSYNSAEFED